MGGEIVVAPGGPVKDLTVCLNGTCRALAMGRILQPGSIERFTVTAAKRRPMGLLVQCSAPTAR